MKPWVAIPLQNGGFALVDKRDAERVCRHRWRRRSDGTVGARIRGRDTRLARFIMQPGRGSSVRNRSGDPSDCRRENLMPHGALARRPAR